MKEFLRRSGYVLLLGLPVLSGCATNACESLVYSETPQASPPLVIPEGVPAPVETGEFRVASGPAAVGETCLAVPPMTLPPEVLADPEDAEDDDA